VVLWTVSGGPDRFSAVTGFALLIATLVAQENVGLFAVFAAPQIAMHGSRAWQRHVAPRQHALLTPLLRRLHPLAMSGVLVAMTAAMAVVVVPRLTTTAAASYQATTYPEAAATYLATTFPGQRVYSIDSWGGYLAYRMPKGRVVFLYDEPAVFGNRALQLYNDIDLLNPDWVQVLAGENIRHAILPTAAREAAALHVLGWTVSCYDATSNSLVMSAPPTGTTPTQGALTVSPIGAPAC
jgi:hypothetical protein